MLLLAVMHHFGDDTDPATWGPGWEYLRALQPHVHSRAVNDAPASVFVAEFLGEANVLHGTREAERLRLSSGEVVELPKRALGAAAFAIRPENLHVSVDRPTDDGTGCVPGRMVQRVFAGAITTCVVDVGGRRMKAVARDRDLPQVPDGADVWLRGETDRLTPIAGP